MGVRPSMRILVPGGGGGAKRSCATLCKRSGPEMNFLLDFLVEPSYHFAGGTSPLLALAVQLSWLEQRPDTPRFQVPSRSGHMQARMNAEIRETPSRCFSLPPFLYLLKNQ